MIFCFGFFSSLIIGGLSIWHIVWLVGQVEEEDEEEA